MVGLDSIISQVLRNCSISDSRHCGVYSVCGLALRLRDLYKWEKGLDPWIEEEPSKILEWIADKEKKWEGLAGDDFTDIELLGSKYNPFDAEGINASLEPNGLIYGAGYAHSLRPTFLLGVVEDKRKVDGCPVYILGQELARDLVTAPVLSQDLCIVIRKEASRAFIWNQIFFIRSSGRNALKVALEHYGIEYEDHKALQKNLTRICAAEIESYIYHELGEMRDTVFDRDIWRNIVSVFPHTPVELLARTVKDQLADTNEYGRLRYIIRERNTGSMALYVAFLDGLRKELFREVTEAFQEFLKTRDWEVIEEAISIGYNTAKQYAETICSIFNTAKQMDDMQWGGDEIQRCLLTPLNSGKHRPHL